MKAFRKEVVGIYDGHGNLLEFEIDDTVMVIMDGARYFGEICTIDHFYFEIFNSNQDENYLFFYGSDIEIEHA